MSNRVHLRHFEGPSEARESPSAAPAPTPPFSFSTTVYRYDETDCDFVYRRRRVTMHLEGVRYYGYRFYNPDLGRWINRDPLTDIVFLHRYMKDLSYEEKANLKEQSKQPAYLFVRNSSIDIVDELGLVFIYDNDCDGVLSISDRIMIDINGLDLAKKNIRLWKKGKKRLLGSFTAKKAECIRKKLLGPRKKFSINCLSSCNPVCLFYGDGFSAPHTGKVGICAQKLKDNSSSPYGEIAGLILHELVHECGKWGHGDADDPDKWSIWLRSKPTASKPKKP